MGAMREAKKLVDDCTQIAKAMKDVERRFTYVPPKDDQPKRYNALRQLALIMANSIVEKCPDSRERSIALTKLEEVIMWANASIARNE